MVISMESPWNEGKIPRKDEQDQHMLLGRFMERSTSAPPISSEQKLSFADEDRGRENIFFGDNTDYNGETGFMNSRSGRDPSSTSGGGTYSGSSLSNALLSSGLRERQPGYEISRSASVGYDGDSHDYHQHHMGKRHVAETSFMRSQSAAPMGPPPGLSSRDQLNQGHYETGMQLGQRRPASTGVIDEEHDASSSVLASLGFETASGGAGAVRPAPKTLMDLINEDIPSSEGLDSFPRAPAGGLIRSQTAAPYYSRGEIGFGDRAQTTSPSMSRLESSYSDRFERGGAMQSPYQQQRQEYQPSDVQGIGNLTNQMSRMDMRSGSHQYSMAQQAGEAEEQYVTIPVSQLQRGIGQEAFQHGQGRPQNRSMYAPSSLQTHPQLSGHQFEGQQQMFYPGGAGSPSMGLDQGMQSAQPALTTAILPNGQTVFLSATPYGYTTVTPQQARMVMPMQGGGQMTYWQGEGGALGPAVIMNQGTPIIMTGTTMDLSPQSSRVKDQKGLSKSRRGTGPGRRDDGRKSSSSIMLEEFRASKTRDWTMLDIKGHVVEFCQDQNGSRFIQQRMEIGNPSEQQVVMAEVLPAVRQLRNDVFGNYVVQKLLEFGTPQMKGDLRDTLKGEMLPLSLQMYGCRVVQKALEALDEDDLPDLLTEFHHNVLSCIHDQNGNHVIQKCIEVMSNKAKQAYATHDGERAKFFSDQIDFIINDVLDNVTALSCHPYGCRVLQRILEHCVEPKKLQALDEISKGHKVLLDDQYGNYVIQHVLQFGRFQDRESILHIICASGLLQLSKQKFASNVIEKLLKYGTPSQRNAIVREMLKIVDDPNAGLSTVVLLMVRDAYANYVVQTTLDVVPEGEEKRLLLEELNAHSAQLRQYTFAKHIVTKLSS